MRNTVAVLLLCSSICFGDTLIMRDGARHDGVLQSTTSRYITFKEGTRVHRYLRSSVQNIELGTASALPNSDETGVGSRNYSDTNRGAYNNRGSAMNGRDRVTLPSGSEIAVMTNDTIDSKTGNSGQVYSADVAQNVVDANGNVVIPKGSEAQLVLRNASAGGVTGTSDLTLDLQSVKVGGHRYMVSTEDVQQQGNSGIGANKRTGEYVGGGAVLGTLIGAIAGGGKGAAIGAATGAAAGAGTQILTRGKSVHVPAETTLRFRLDQPLQLQRAY
jgi:hypothetical protein